MNWLLKIILNALAVILVATILPGVGIASFWSALGVALVLAFLKFLVRPILVILTIPITVITFGLFLLVINAIIVLLADWFVSGFMVDSFWWALIFSVLLSIAQGIIDSILKRSNREETTI